MGFNSGFKGLKVNFTQLKTCHSVTPSPCYSVYAM